MTTFITVPSETITTTNRPPAPPAPEKHESPGTEAVGPTLASGRCSAADGGPTPPTSSEDGLAECGVGRLIIVPIALRTARAFIAWSHRHLLPPQGAKFAIGVNTPDGTLVGVVTAGRPVSRVLDDGFTIEVTRLATDGTSNACSALLGAAWRAARAMGYRRLITYTRADEPGTSLHAAGLRRVAACPARKGWDTPSRPRTSRGADHTARVLWEVSTGTNQSHGSAR
jgi:hypothetical protein